MEAPGDSKASILTPIDLANDAFHLTTDEHEKLQHLFERINTGLHSSPAAFVPTVRTMLVNVEHKAATALSTFSKYTGVPAAYRRRFDARIGVQPTATGRRKFGLAGRRPLGPGRPRYDDKVCVPHDLQVHNYTTFGRLQTRKQTVPHNLQEYVFRDVGLGCTKQVVAGRRAEGRLQNRAPKGSAIIFCDTKYTEFL